MEKAKTRAEKKQSQHKFPITTLDELKELIFLSMFYLFWNKQQWAYLVLFSEVWVGFQRHNLTAGMENGEGGERHWSLQGKQQDTLLRKTSTRGKDTSL